MRACHVFDMAEGTDRCHLEKPLPNAISSENCKGPMSSVPNDLQIYPLVIQHSQQSSSQAQPCSSTNAHQQPHWLGPPIPHPSTNFNKIKNDLHATASKDVPDNSDIASQITIIKPGEMYVTSVKIRLGLGL